MWGDAQEPIILAGYFPVSAGGGREHTRVRGLVSEAVDEQFGRPEIGDCSRRRVHAAGKGFATTLPSRQSQASRCVEAMYEWQLRGVRWIVDCKYSIEAEFENIRRALRATERIPVR